MLPDDKKDRAALLGAYANLGGTTTGDVVIDGLVNELATLKDDLVDLEDERAIAVKQGEIRQTKRFLDRFQYGMQGVDPE